MKLVSIAFVVAFLALPGTRSKPQPWTTGLYNPALPYPRTYTQAPVPGFRGYPYSYYDQQCRQQLTTEVNAEFTRAIYEAGTKIYKKAALVSDNHFVISLFSIWLTLAALAEGSELALQQRMFAFLNLPTDRCIRQLYYKLATEKEVSNSEILLQRNRQIIFDTNVARLNPVWQEFVTANSLIDISTSPYKTYPDKEIDSFRTVFNARLPNINLNGNSLILESLDYYGLWTNAFSNGKIESAPFYDSFGESLGNIEYMRTRMPAKIANLPGMNAKVLELPVGSDQKYKFLVIMPLDNQEIGMEVADLKSTIVSEIFQKLQTTPKPIDIVIPRMVMTSEIDVRKLMEEPDFNPVWTEPFATSNISDPSAIPSSYNQRVTITLDTNGINPTIQTFSNFVPPLPEASNFNTTTDPVFESDFVANRPFMFGFINSENYFSSFAGTFSKVIY